MQYVFFNNTFIAEDECCLHYRDLSVQRGYGIFEFFRLCGNTPLFLEDHLNRFFFSADLMRLTVNFSRDELKKIIAELIKKNNLPDSGIHITVTGGISADGITPGEPNIIISQHAFKPPAAQQKSVGLKLISYHHQRQLPQVKTIDYLMAIWLKPLLQHSGADDILYHQNGSITECPRNNFFIVTEDDTIITPKDEILNGITRMKVLQIARKNFHVEERQLFLDEIKNAREAFVTSTTKQILPVSQVDANVFQGRKVTAKLQQDFSALVQEHISSPNLQ